MNLFYFKRKADGPISQSEHFSSEAGVVGIVSFLYYTIGLPARWQSFSAILTGACFGICTIASLVSVYKEYKTSHRINVFCLLRMIVALAFCIVSFTCLDYFLL